MVEVCDGAYYLPSALWTEHILSGLDFDVDMPVILNLRATCKALGPLLAHFPLAGRLPSIDGTGVPVSWLRIPHLATAAFLSGYRHPCFANPNYLTLSESALEAGLVNRPQTRVLRTVSDYDTGTLECLFVRAAISANAEDRVRGLLTSAGASLRTNRAGLLVFTRSLGRRMDCPWAAFYGMIMPMGRDAINEYIAGGAVRCLEAIVAVRGYDYTTLLHIKDHASRKARSPTADPAYARVRDWVAPLVKNAQRERKRVADAERRLIQKRKREEEVAATTTTVTGAEEPPAKKARLEEEEEEEEEAAPLQPPMMEAERAMQLLTGFMNQA